MSKPATSCSNYIKFSWFLLIQILLSPISGQTASTLTVKNIIALLELDQDQIANLEQGKIIAFEVKESSPKELAGGLAIYLPSPPAKLVTFFNKGDMATIDPDVSVFGEISPKSGKEAFKGFVFTPQQHDEVQHLLNTEPGDQFNLSSEEIHGFAALREQLTNSNKVSSVSKVSQHYQHILWNRWNAYRNKGLVGIVPYAREETESSPAEELRSAAVNSQLLALFSPALQQAWLNYPSQLPKGAEERFFWLNRQVNDRPTAILSHRILLASDASSVIITRQFFVGHSYNSSHLIVGCLPYREGAIVFYTHRTYTDQVTGLGNNLKRSIGREQMKKQMVKNLKGLRSAVKRL
ncbi:hypothetical protein SAMN05421880_1052 [Nitrosomonas nitrosa]|uniref:Uncharacterized protein n=1 Tax=Nitrosomonas nitrosa TaxID=52442 RepID=A0A1I4MMM7_9PROT|nr:hypothetical protein [Nitrosomonas nitrosa]SFM04340.1 hypothetical protein SAMN05421880_1052 [Nitrosomonas nitrosa]